MLSLDQSVLAGLMPIFAYPKLSKALDVAGFRYIGNAVNETVSMAEDDGYSALDLTTRRLTGKNLGTQPEYVFVHISTKT